MSHHGKYWKQERSFPCMECGAKPGECCTALRNGRFTKAGVSAVPNHVSRTLAAREERERSAALREDQK